MSAEKALKVPNGTKAGGRRLWLSIVDEYDLEEHELTLLREAVRTVDALDVLDKLVKDEGAIVLGPHGSKAHPALTEARQQRLALARILAALRLPEDDDGEGAVERTQRRAGVRQPYSLKSVS